MTKEQLDKLSPEEKRYAIARAVADIVRAQSDGAGHYDSQSGTKIIRATAQQLADAFLLAVAP